MSFTFKHLKSLAEVAVRYNASDIHIRSDEAPSLRIHGELVPVQSKVFGHNDILNLIKIILKDENFKDVGKKELDGSHEVEGVCRLRYNIFQYDKKVGVVFRIIKTTVPTIDELGFDETLKKIALRHRGLVLVTGATGSGKSTTLAAIINYINNKRATHIVSIEDPIEYVHQNQISRITQREVGIDTTDFSSALKSALRQDPDVILIGEMRDTETISTALKAAETGHLVLSTMHTTDALSTIGRIIGMFPSEEQEEIRERLSENLYATIGQRMVKGLNDNIVVAQEIMISTPGIKECILGEEPLQNITSILERGFSEAGNGSRTFDQELMRLFKSGRIDKKTALEAATSGDDFIQKLIIDRSY